MYNNYWRSVISYSDYKKVTDWDEESIYNSVFKESLSIGSTVVISLRYFIIRWHRIVISALVPTRLFVRC